MRAPGIFSRIWKAAFVSSVAFLATSAGSPLRQENLMYGWPGWSTVGHPWQQRILMSLCGADVSFVAAAKAQARCIKSAADTWGRLSGAVNQSGESCTSTVLCWDWLRCRDCKAGRLNGSCRHTVVLTVHVRSSRGPLGTLLQSEA